MRNFNLETPIKTDVSMTRSEVAGVLHKAMIAMLERHGCEWNWGFEKTNEWEVDFEKIFGMSVMCG